MMKPPKFTLAVLLLGGALVSQNVPGNSLPHDFTSLVFGSTVLFAANDNSGVKLWRADATVLGATLVNVPPGTSNPREITATLGLPNAAFVLVADTTSGPRLLRVGFPPTDATEITSAAVWTAAPRLLTMAGSQLYFVAATAAAGEELWSYDGINPPTPVRDIVPGAGSSEPRNLAYQGNLLLFSAATALGGREPWRSDGSLAGTYQLQDINPGPGGSGPRDFLAGNRLFSAFNPTTGIELWNTNGTTGATPVADIAAGSQGSAPSSFAQGLVPVFAATTAAEGRELWFSNGATAGLVADIRAGSMGSDPKDVVQVGLLEYWFVADDGSFGREIWRTIFIGSGWITTRVTDIEPGIGSVFPESLRRLSGTNFLVFQNSTRGDPTLTPTLYRVDITTGAVTVLRSFKSGPVGLHAFGLPTPGRAIFAANDGDTGVEPWVTDGTPGGTVLLANIAADPVGDTASLSGHVNDPGTQWTLCLREGPAGAIGLFGVDFAPIPPTPVPILTGPALLNPAVTVTSVFSANGVACVTVPLPPTLTTLELVAQGFIFDPTPPSFPLPSSDLVAFGLSVATTTAFGGDTKSAGTLQDDDHRYRITISLPAGAQGQQGTFLMKYRDPSGALQEFSPDEVDEREFVHPFDGTSLVVALEGQVPKAGIKGIELWFVPAGASLSTQHIFLWKSYC